MKNLDFINNSGSLSIENFVLSNDSVPVNNLSSNERPIFMSEFAQRLVSRGWNIPIRRKVSTSGSSTDLSIVPGFCDNPNIADIDVTKGVYKVEAGSGVQLGSNRIIPQEQITRFTENYYKEVLKMKENDGITLYSSSKVVVDFLNNSITVDLIADDEYTNTISLVSVENKLAKNNLSAKVDLTVSYTKNGELFGQDLTFEAFKYSSVNDNIVSDRKNFISYINNEVVVEYMDGIIRVIPESNSIDECIINNCVLTYGCI